MRIIDLVLRFQKESKLELPDSAAKALVNSIALDLIEAYSLIEIIDESGMK